MISYLSGTESLRLIEAKTKYKPMVAAPTQEHSHVRSGKRYLVIALGITAAFFVIELIGGFITNSLALTADAWHMLNDASALAFALAAAWLAERPIDTRKTYGYYRTEILAAFLNGVFLWVVVAFIFYEAILRLQNPVAVESLNMLIIAFFGLAANGLSALALSRSERHSLNVRGAFLHVLSDTLGSVGAISAGLIMYFTGWYVADPLISMLVGLLIFYGAFKLARESVNVLLEGVPSGIETEEVEKEILGVSGVEAIHDLHIWCITPTRMCIMSVHVVVKEEADKKKLMLDLMSTLKEKFGIDHTTIQLEDEGYPKAPSEH